ncbi:hypothetical protein CCMSSC00406_0007756 [Pleurotus cornucopiae]|uniref:Uncharacterized protein n=1 Tax=Pleurotus cornucopiae TaxID=5321 RepID=A0ACB7J6P4_PLECO|nr:hypothetical protein CCMSSC00406_0007756 [Pleurotus cornucopiae]
MGRFTWTYDIPAPDNVAAQLPNPNAISAYNICFDLEQSASTPINNKHLIAARVLGYLILHAPSHHALAEVVKTIHSCRQNNLTLYALGEAFIVWFIRPFKKCKGRTPDSSLHPSRPSFGKDAAALKASIQEAPRDHSTAKRHALIRDGYRCLITRRYDRAAENKLDITPEELVAYGGLIATQCAHIIPASTYFDVNITRKSTPDPNEKDYAASVLAVLKRFGYDVDTLNGAGVHSLFNVMTLERNVHDMFDQLLLWLEATETANSYRVKVANPLYFPGGPDVVAFSTPDPEHLPVPSPHLLSLHAACAKVAHLSGAAEYIDNLDREMEATKVLAFDGGSADILHHAIARLAGERIDASSSPRSLCELIKNAGPQHGVPYQEIVEAPVAPLLCAPSTPETISILKVVDDARKKNEGNKEPAPGKESRDAFKLGISTEMSSESEFNLIFASGTFASDAMWRSKWFAVNPPISNSSRSAASALPVYHVPR